MITGGLSDTAGAITRKLGIFDGHQVVLGSELMKINDDELLALRSQ